MNSPTSRWQNQFWDYVGNDFRGTLENARNYLLGEAAARGVVILTIPIFTYLLSAAEYGVFQVYQSYSAILVVLLTLNFHASAGRYYYDEPQDYGAFLGTSLAGSLLFLSVAFVGIGFYREQFAALLGIPYLLVLLLPVQIVAAIFHSIFTQICVSREQSARRAWFIALHTWLGVGLGIGFISLFEEDRYLGPVLGLVAAAVPAAVYAARPLFRELRWAFSRDHVRYIVSYSVALLPYTLSTIFLGQIDRVMINKLRGAEEAGVYSIAYNIAMSLALVSQVLNQALIPQWFRLMRAGKFGAVDAVVDRAFRITLLGAAGLVFFSVDAMRLVIDSRYHEALYLIPVITVGYVFEAVFRTYGRSIGFTTRMIFVALVGVTAGTLNVVLNLVYIPTYGYKAAAYTTVISYAVMAGLAWLVASRLLKQRITPVRVLLSPMLAFSAGVVVYVLLTASELEGAFLLLAKGAAFLGTGAAILRFRSTLGSDEPEPVS